MGIVYILFTAILFTTLEPVSKLIANDISPLTLTFIRFFIGGLILLPFSIKNLMINKIKLTKYDVLKMVLLGALCICVSMPLLQMAVKTNTPTANVAIVFSANSVFTLILSAIILKEKLTAQKIVGLILCILGLIISTNFKLSNEITGILLAVLAALSFSVYTVLSKKLMTNCKGVIQTGISFLSGSIILMLLLIFSGNNIMGGVNSANLVTILYLGIAVTGIGYFSYFKAMELSSAMGASLVFFIKAVLTPIATFFILGQLPSYITYISLGLVLAGSIISTTNFKIRKKFNDR